MIVHRALMSLGACVLCHPCMLYMHLSLPLPPCLTISLSFSSRLKAGLKLQEEAEKREVEKGIHLLQDPEGIK